jgi:(p)ppGpp synthase/HD superfamily hydrolase
MGKDDNKLLEKTIELAKTHHAGAFDKGGHLYIGHPLRLMEKMDRRSNELWRRSRAL